MNKKQSTFLLQTILPVLVPFLIFIAHAVYFGNYIIDDAGISFAYARNLASGYGLVSQPGMLPVEGYSNFTWVVLMAPFFMLHLFDPIITPKIIGSLLILAIFYIINQILKQTSQRPTIGTFLVLTFLSINTSFVMWAVAGLENPLYALLVILIVFFTIRNYQNPQTKYIITLAVIAAFCALTRPDGVLFSLIYPGFTALAWLFSKDKPALKEIIKKLAIYAGVFLLIYGSYLVFRYFYFHDLYPNTYWAKGGSLAMEPKEWYTKIRDLTKSFGLTRYTLVVFVLMAAYTLISKSVKKAEEWIVFIALAIAFAIYTLLPSDWMPEFRFATPLIMLFFPAAFILLDRFVDKLIPNKKGALALLLALFALWFIKSTPDYYERSQVQINDPMISFNYITETYAIPFNEYAEALDIDDASLLIPDLGGTLYYSNLKIYDLAGLTDKTIALYLRKEKNKPIFYDYIFETIKPTFIHTHKIWAYHTQFDNDPRFREDYVPIEEGYDEWIQYGYREDMYSGDYVRKDALKDPQLLIDLQESLK